jgi:hypothetical protein
MMEVWYCLILEFCLQKSVKIVKYYVSSVVFKSVLAA